MSSPSFSILAEVQMSQGWDLGLSGFTLATNFFLAWLHSEHNDLVPRIPNCLTTPPPNSALCCGVRMTSGSSKPLHVTVIPQGSCCFAPSSPRPCSKGRGMGVGKRTEQPILTQTSGADTHGGHHCCHGLLTDRDLLPVIALQA